MKKLWIILVNIILLFMVAFVADYFIYKSEIKELYKYSPSLAETQAKISYFDFYRSGYWVQSIQKYKHYVKGEELERFRPIFNEKSLQAPILIFGCSFVYGSSLSENQTLSYKLAKETQRPIHTWGQEATGPAHMLFLLQNNIVFEKLKNSNDPEYAIWLYIPSHISRLFVNIFPHPLIINGINLKYEIKNDELKLVKNKLPDFFFMTFLVKKFFANIDNKNRELAKTEENKEKYFVLFNKIFLESKRLLQEKYPDIKFVIINYNLDYEQESMLEPPHMWETLEKEGFIIINTKDLVGQEYTKKDTTIDNFHPSEEVWENLVPKLIETLNL